MQNDHIQHHRSKARSLPMLYLSPVQTGYLAGIIDGEGSVSISRKKDHTGMKRGYCYRMNVSVSNTNIYLLEWILKNTGLGAICSASPRKGNQKPAWRWMAWSLQANQILEAVHPYLIVKPRQAALAIEFMEAKRDGVGRRGLSDAEWENQERIYREVGILNKRGIIDG